MTMDIHGTIKNAVRDYLGCVSGSIYGDTKGRFQDGDFIRTSKIIKELPNNIIRTRNSVYRCEWLPEARSR